jgi:hypothetical protein
LTAEVNARRAFAQPVQIWSRIAVVSQCPPKLVARGHAAKLGKNADMDADR